MLVDYANKREVTHTARCSHCGVQWERTGRVGKKVFMCPHCATQDAATWVEAVMPPDGTPAFQCECKSVVFMICPEGFYCGRCGLLHERDTLKFLSH